MRKLIAIILLSSLLLGCETIKYVDRPVVVPVPILPLPELPKLSQEQANSIREDVHLILVERDETWRQHVIKINRIIEAHNKPKE